MVEWIVAMWAKVLETYGALRCRWSWNGHQFVVTYDSGVFCGKHGCFYRTVCIWCSRCYAEHEYERVGFVSKTGSLSHFHGEDRGYANLEGQRWPGKWWGHTSEVET